LENLCVIDDRSAEAAALLRALRSSHTFHVHVEHGPLPKKWLGAACVLLPLGLIDSGLTRMRELRTAGYQGALVFYAASPRDEVVLSALRAGAQDVVLPSDSPSFLRRAVHNAVARQTVVQAAPSDDKRRWIYDRFMEAQALAKVGSWEVDVGSWEVEWSPEFRRIVGVGPDDKPLALEGYSERVHPLDRSRVVAELLGLFQQGRGFDSEHRLIRPDETTIYVHAIGRSEHSADGTLVRVYGTTQDVTDRKKLEQELAERSLRDELTGLLNRRGFMLLADQQLKLAERTTEKPALCFLDLDGLKAINDEFGHDAGDAVLRDAAGVLLRTFRSSDVVARLGGDEFAALITHASPALTEALNERLRAELEEHNSGAPQTHRLSLSCGFSFYDPAKRSTVDALVAEADSQMYVEKRSRRSSGAPVEP
jgi:diguanylate cyclase (GGDEF)-like protein/PAS domain S-box-containing protein